MNKKIFAIVAASVLVLSFASCKKETEKPNNDNQIDNTQYPEGLEWDITTDHLFITGSGSLAQLNDEETGVAPWNYIKPDLASLEIKGNFDEIPAEAFSGYNKLEDVELPDSLKKIGEKAFYECTWLEEVDIPDSVTTIEESAFSHCINLSEAELPDNLESVSDSLFYLCISLKSAELGDSATSIGADAFSSCFSLSEIDIPATVTKIGENAFFDCDSLKTVNFSGSKAQWEKIEIAEGNEALSNATVNFNE